MTIKGNEKMEDKKLGGRCMEDASKKWVEDA